MLQTDFTKKELSLKIREFDYRNVISRKDTFTKNPKSHSKKLQTDFTEKETPLDKNPSI